MKTNVWIDVKKELPAANEKVLVWVKYDGDSEFEWSDSERTFDEEKDLGAYPPYIEPISKVGWIMGSAKNYVITHWMRINSPK